MTSDTPLAGNHTRAIVAAIAFVAGCPELAYALLNLSAMPVYLNMDRLQGGMGYGADAVAGIGTAFLLCEGLMKGPFGILGDRVGRKWLIIAGPLVSVFTSLITLLVRPSEWYLFVALRVLDGMGAAALWPAALAMIADVVTEDRRSQAMSLFNVTYLVGIALGPFIGGVANDVTAIITQGVPRMIASHGPAIVAQHVHARVVNPLHASFYVASLLFLVTALVAWRRIPNVPPHHERHPTDLEAGFSLSALLQSLRQIPEMLIMAFVTFLGIGLVMLLIKLFAMAEFGISETRFGALLLVPCLIIAVASVPLGTVGDRIGKARAVRVGIGLCALSMWSLVLIRNEVALVLGGSVIGVGFVIAFPSWMAYISQTSDPRQRGAVMGAVGTAQGLGAMVGAPLGGYMYQHAHIHIWFMPWINARYTPFIGCALLLLVSWLISLVSIREQPPRPEEPHP